MAEFDERIRQETQCRTIGARAQFGIEAKALCCQSSGQRPLAPHPFDGF
jgi:hypothetical protein